MLGKGEILRFAQNDIIGTQPQAAFSHSEKARLRLQSRLGMSTLAFAILCHKEGT
jgi:hypothetical protein